MKTELTYRNLFKSTALLGSVQMVTLFLNIIRGKVVAWLLGATGLGIMSLYTMVTNLVTQFTGLGFNVSGVREIAAADDAAIKVKAMRRISIVAAAAGMAFMVAASRWLSLITFGDDSYTTGFMLLGILVFANTLTVCENAVLQGHRQLKSIAFCNVMSSLLGVIVGLPFYYVMGERGIAPALVLSSVLFYVITRYRSGKIHLSAVHRMTWRDCWREGRPLLALGLSMTVGYVLGSTASYVISGGVRYLGCVSDVGLFSAATTITSQWSAIVFMAIATDYLPKLSRVARNKQESFLLINKQTDLVVLAVAPITVLVIFLSPVIIRLLLTTDFLRTVQLVRWLALTTFLQACYFPMGYLPIAHGDKRLYFWLECIWTNVKTPLFMLTGYYFWGLWGLGYASVFNALVDMVVTMVVMRWRYDAALSWRTKRLTTQLSLVVLCCFGASFISNLWIAYSLMGVIAVVAVVIALREFNQRLMLKNLLRSFISTRMRG